jgi:Peptidase A4 family
VNKFYRVTGTAVAALTLAASAAAFGAPYAAAQATVPHAAAAPAAGMPAPHPNIPAALPAGVAAGANSTFGIKKVGSQNWAGYAVTRGKFKKIRASFYVPIMNCNSVPDTFSSHWVGLDGFNSKTVEQDGIEADCLSGHERVFAWREVFPRPEQPFTTLKIRPGDSITATTTFLKSSHKFKMEVKDNTTGQHRTVRQGCAGATCHRSSAEVISEAPTVNGSQSSLAPYGAQAFSGISIHNSKGRSGGIRSSHWNAFRIFQIGANSGNLIAAPTALHGPAFAVYWLGFI